MLSSKDIKHVKRFVFGVVVFIVVLLNINSFKKAVYEPFADWIVTYFNSEWEANLVILIASILVLVYLGRKLPFVKE